MERKVFGVVGWKNSGKTTLIVALIEELRARGLTVSTIKHAHHHFDIDVPGKDSHRHRAAGAREVLVSSDGRWALMHENEHAAAPELDVLIERLAPCDLILVEGFKADRHPKIETAWSQTSMLIADSDPTVLAVVTDHLLATPARMIFSPRDIAGIAEFVLRATGIVPSARRSTGSL